jgi:hypothetical protein
VLLDKESMRINNMRPATPQEVWVDCGLAIFGSEEYMAPEVWAERGYPSKAVEAASTWSAMMYSIGRIVAALCAFCTDQYFPVSVYGRVQGVVRGPHVSYVGGCKVWSGGLVLVRLCLSLVTCASW